MRTKRRLNKPPYRKALMTKRSVLEHTTAWRRTFHAMHIETPYFGALQAMQRTVRQVVSYLQARGALAPLNSLNCNDRRTQAP